MLQRCVAGQAPQPGSRHAVCPLQSLPARFGTPMADPLYSKICMKGGSSRAGRVTCRRIALLCASKRSSASCCAFPRSMRSHIRDILQETKRGVKAKWTRGESKAATAQAVARTDTACHAQHSCHTQERIRLLPASKSVSRYRKAIQERLDRSRLGRWSPALTDIPLGRLPGLFARVNKGYERFAPLPAPLRAIRKLGRSTSANAARKSTVIDVSRSPTGNDATA